MLILSLSTIFQLIYCFLENNQHTKGFLFQYKAILVFIIQKSQIYKQTYKFPQEYPMLMEYKQKIYQTITDNEFLHYLSMEIQKLCNYMQELFSFEEMLNEFQIS